MPTTSSASSGSTARVEIRPQPGPQLRFLTTKADIAIYGGAAGGGKTWGLLLEPLRHVARVKDYGAVIFRRTSKQVKNEGGMWDESYKLYPHLGAVSKEGSMEWLFPPHENRVRFAHMEHAKNRFDWQGAQIPFIGWDELTHFEEEMFFYMLSRNRSTCGVRPYVRATTNPDADSWVAELIAWWVDQDTGFPILERAGVLRWFIRPEADLIWADSPQQLRQRYPRAEPKSLTFIPAKVSDNQILMAKDPGYVATLHTLPPVERARLLMGNWKVRAAAGLMFSRTWFRVVDAPPYQVVARVRYWDKAGTAGGGAYTAGVLMSRTPDDLYVVEDVVRGQWAAPDRERVIRETARADGRDVEVWLEQEPGSGGKESAEATIRRLAGHAVYAERPTGDKVERAAPLSAQAEARNVAVVRAGWNRSFFDEAEAFPDGHLKDQVDGAAGAFNRLASLVVVEDFDERELDAGVIPESEIGGRFA